MAQSAVLLFLLWNVLSSQQVFFAESRGTVRVSINYFEMFADCDGWTQRNPDCDLYFCYCVHLGFTGDCNVHCPNNDRSIGGERFYPSQISRVLATPFNIRYPGGDFTFKFEAWDDDDALHFDDDHMTTIRVKVQLRAGTTMSYISRGSHRSRLDTSFSLTCSKNYYGDHCTVYCVSPTHGYCNRQGRVVCHSNYYSPSTGCSRRCIKPTHGYCDSNGNVVCHANYYSPSTGCRRRCIKPTHGSCDSNGNVVCHANYYSPSTRCGTHCVTPKNGHCNSSGLTCNEGWTGTDCNLTFIDCIEAGDIAHCQNNGTCRINLLTRSRSCVCTSAYTGDACEHGDCRVPNTPANGNASFLGTTVGYEVNYTCSTGYKLIGNSNRICESGGQWSGSLPSCSRDCKTVSSPPNGRANVSGTTVGYTVTYSCNPEYQLIGISNRTCQDNGEWSGTPPSCSRDCRVPNTPANGNASFLGTTVGYEVNYACSTGYKLIGNSNRICESGGQWSGSLPSCSRDCKTVSSPPNGRANVSGTTVGYTVTYSCNPEYKLVGISNRTCQDNGEWSGTPPSCSRDCGAPRNPANAEMHVSGTTVGHTVLYNCSTMYKLIGSSRRTCQNSGEWSGTPPSCTRDCGIPDAPVNGNVSLSSTTVGHTVNYTCEQEYKLVGTSSRTCQSNGQWSGTQPSCSLISCGNLTDPRNGHVNVESTRYQGIAKYECDSGYELSGEDVLTCQISEQWSGTPPQCIDINECEAQTYNCHPKHEYCFNREGGFDCKCKPGYVLSDAESCIDLNECETGQHTCNPNTSVCFNSVGSYSCVCRSGFEDFVNSESRRICKDIDECRTGNCEHRCGNTLGSYQCHCNEGYSLQGNKCKRHTPPCAVEQLPVPRNSSVNCKTVNAVLECKLKCHHMFKFGSSQDFSVQNCNDGVWDYERDQIDIPDCQHIKERVAVITGHMESNETCLAHQKFRKFPEQDALLPAVIEAKCKQLSTSRQNGSAAEVGKLVITFTFSQVIPFSCGSACIHKLQFPLRSRFEAVQQRVASGLALFMENLETSDLVNVTLHGKLHGGNDNVQITCQSGQMLSEDICIPCAPGSFLNSTGPTATCDPCPFHYYQDESEQTECKACPNRTFTIARGSSERGHCRAPCSPGTASWSGLAPCKECKKGFYQPESGANFCHKCDFDQITHSSGSRRKEDCGCPAGTYWNDCIEKCSCSNGGICELDGSCICPQGLTGPYCTKKDAFRACHDSYLISYGKNVDNQQMRHIFALTGANNGSVSVTMKFTDESTSQVSDYRIGSEDQLDLPFLPTVSVVHISVSRGISILGDIDEEEDGDTFAALPIFPILGETKFEEYLVLSHASKNLLTNVMGVILVVAATDNTQVIVIPAENISDVEGGIFLEKNNVTVFVQHRLNTLTLTSVNDLTGTVIRADKPIAVYSGHVCGNIPVHVSSCGHLIEQMPPVRVLGYCYIVTSFMGRQDGSYVKFVAAVDVTYVEAYEDDNIVVTYGPLYQGMFHERYLDPGRVLVLKSSHPIMVAQFSPGAQLDDVGAPFMIVLPSLSQLVSEVPFYSKNNSDVNYFHYITVTVPSQYYDEDSIILDGDPIHSNATTTVQSPLCGNFTLVSLEVAPGHHYLQHTTPGAGLLLSVYGFAPGTSYGYSPGLNQVLSRDGASSSMEDHQE